MQWLLDALERSASGERLGQQLRFVMELDRAKTVLRRTYIVDGSRLENDGEHMWHVMVAAWVLAEHSDEPVDPMRLALMLAVHDIVEIDAGDTFLYAGPAAQAEKVVRERRAADRIFGLLPAEQAGELRELWEEFEEHKSATARMAAAIDRLLPLLMNRATGGRTWRDHSVTSDRVVETNSPIGAGSSALWAFAHSVLEEATTSGVLESGPAPATSDGAGLTPGPAG